MGRFVMLLTAIAVLALSPAAEAAKKRTIKSTGTVQGHTAVEPAEGQPLLFTGYSVDSKAGEGVLLSKGTSQDGKLVGTFRAYVNDGSLKGTFDITATPSSDPNVLDLTGSTKITGGGGSGKGAKGSGTLTGTQNLQTGYIVLNYTQSYKVRKRKS